MQHLLLIEDDEALGAQVVEHLEGAGFALQWWKSGQRIETGDLAQVSLVVLDLMLPGVHGLDLLKEIRAACEVPVLVLSARLDSADKVRALALGADDYLTKPFWPRELIERVRARLRRPILQPHDRLEVGSLQLDLTHRKARFAGRELDLTRVEYDLLSALAQRRSRPISRDWLLENVLDPERRATTRTLDVHISRIRKKLGDPAVIQTVWGIGYQFVTGDAS